MTDELIRKSQVMHWKKCPLLYEYIWIEKIPSPPSVEQQFGTRFHQQAARFFKELDYDKLLTCKTKDDANILFAEFLPEQPVVREWMTNFIWFEACRWEEIVKLTGGKLDYWKPIVVEKELEAPAVGFLMHIDRIDRMISRFFINIDYKTNKYMKLADLRFELTFYNIGINSTNLLDHPCTWIGCYNPSLNQVFAEEVKTRTINRVMKTVRKFKQSKAEGIYPPKPSFLCRYCVALDRCLSADIFTAEFLSKMNEWQKEENERGEE